MSIVCTCTSATFHERHPSECVEAFISTCTIGHLSIIEMFLPFFFDNAAEMKNAFATSIRNGHLSIVEMFVDRVSKNIITRQCIDMAYNHGFLEILNFLMSALNSKFSVCSASNNDWLIVSALIVVIHLIPLKFVYNFNYSKHREMKWNGC